MTNTEAPHPVEVARALVAAGEAVVAEHKAEHDGYGFRDWGDMELAREFSRAHDGVRFWASADGREVHCAMTGTQFSHLPSAFLDLACDKVDFTWHERQRIEEVAPGHDVLYFW